MTHLRDIQKLRQTRNSQQIALTSRITPQQNTMDLYNLNFDKIGDVEPKNSFNRNSDLYSRFLQSKEILPKTREKKSTHKRGNSNGMTYYEKRQSEQLSSGLSIYNFSVKLGQKTPNPLTSRKEKPLEMFDFEQPEIKQRRFLKEPNKNLEITKAQFDVVYPIGKGGFGKVWKVQHKKNKQMFALKEMYKAKIIQKKSINSVMNERNLLSKVRHSFLINMSFAFQDRQNLYLMMDYLDGGDLRYHIGKRRRFSQLETKFFLANLIVGLEYLHSNKIIHRDIKPQNLVLDSDGYLRITDLGISRQFKDQNYQDTSGTPGYMAPEVMCRKNHSYPVDYFAMGVMGYEFMLGRRPYVGKNRKEIRDQILSKQALIKIEELPQKWSYESVDFINKLLQRNPAVRLGTNGIEELKNHEWMKGVDWMKLQKKQLKAPYLPISIEEDYDDYKEQISEDSIDENQEENLLMLRDPEVQSLFEGYYFDRRDHKHQKKKNTSYTTYSTETDYSRKQTR